MHRAATSRHIEKSPPFAWLPVELIAQAVETASRLGMQVSDIEGRHRELILRMATGASLRVIVAESGPVHLGH